MTTNLGVVSSQRRFRRQPELQIVGEVSDGLEAVQKAQELQPDLILLDIGLPTLNGIEAARRILQVSPKIQNPLRKRKSILGHRRRSACARARAAMSSSRMPQANYCLL